MPASPIRRVDPQVVSSAPEARKSLGTPKKRKPAGPSTSGVVIELLEERGWLREQAYVLCSVAVDLRVSNVVDVPNVTVSALLPEDIFLR